MGRTSCVSVFLLASSLALSSHASETVSCKVRVVFFSQGSIGEAVIQEIRKTRSKLSLALYGFNNLVFAEELVKLARQGINVRVKVDERKSMKKRHRQVVQLLKAAGISVQAVGHEGKNHDKFAVIDEAKVITGSYNWTFRAEQNWENLLILDCPDWQKCTKRNGRPFGETPLVLLL